MGASGIYLVQTNKMIIFQRSDFTQRWSWPDRFFRIHNQFIYRQFKERGLSGLSERTNVIYCRSQCKSRWTVVSYLKPSLSYSNHTFCQDITLVSSHERTAAEMCDIGKSKEVGNMNHTANRQQLYVRVLPPCSQPSARLDWSSWYWPSTEKSLSSPACFFTGS